ncbi:DUF1844 domain-containing protein [bacterium]|nr:DUF1844 domain-containing protein [bacterium]MBU1152909.1 DUF1844 domain-containing protein [bacterium]MBU1782628.1 DUF1844 domain-containing protein [bacterium]MBU2599557.1 DUF1844 domain-containing protein [bacterium]
MENNKDETCQETKEEEKQEIPFQKAQFLDLVFMLSTSAFQHLGEVADPVENKKKVDLPSAKYTIDLVSLLQEKTKSNLTDSESKILDDILYNLRMKYLEMTNKKVKEG